MVADRRSRRALPPRQGSRVHAFGAFPGVILEIFNPQHPHQAHRHMAGDMHEPAALTTASITMVRSAARDQLCMQLQHGTGKNSGRT